MPRLVIQIEGHPAREFEIAARPLTLGRSPDCDVTIDDYSEDGDGKSATVRFTCIATSIVNYKEQKFDCSDNLALVKEDDGKWHVILAMGRTLRPM